MTVKSYGFLRYSISARPHICNFQKNLHQLFFSTINKSRIYKGTDKSLEGFKDTSKKFESVFRSSSDEKSTQSVKISKEGTSDALFRECLDAIRRKRCEIDPDVHTRMYSDKIKKMNQDELDIVKKILKRIDPEKEYTSQIESPQGHIDPFWSPFSKVEDLKSQVMHEYTEYSKLVGAAEARKQKLQIRQSLKRCYKLYNPLSEENKKYHWRKSSEAYPTPINVSERFWDPSPDIRRALKNNNIPITFRDLHILHNFIGENGLVLPRRITFASRLQQRYIFKAICIARRLALFPYDYKPEKDELMPIMDPIQYLVDELTERYVMKKDRRAKAMLLIAMQKYSNLNYHRYLRYESEMNSSSEQVKIQAEEENNNDFSRILKKYKEMNSRHSYRANSS